MYHPIAQQTIASRWMIFILGLVSLRGPLAGQEPARSWRSELEFRQVLESPANIVWHDLPISDAVRSLSSAYQIGVFRDRRVDPGLRLNYQSADRTLRETLVEALSSRRLSIGSIGPVLYIGPARTAVLVATVAVRSAEQLQDLERSRRERLLRRKAMSWPRLTTPRSLLSQLALEAGLEVVNPQLVPHDLWDVQELPPLTWPERMTLVLCGFDLTYQIDPTQLQIVLTAMPRAVTVSRTYPVGPATTEVAREIAKMHPQAFIREDQDQLVIRSVVEDHWMIESWLQRWGRSDRGTGPPEKSPEVPLTNRRFTLTVQDQPVGPLLRVLAQRVGYELNMDPDLKELLNLRVSFSVQQVPLAELFQAAAAPAGLSTKIQGQTIHVGRAD